MNLPNAELATLEPAKVRDYLLNRSHPVGRFKAAFFEALGYQADAWEVLQADLLELGRTAPCRVGQPSEFGAKYEVSGILSGRSGRSAAITTIWIILGDDPAPRFVTAYPS